jgi:thiosulfate/3-mercaptopyruvate sulfurtransferase
MSHRYVSRSMVLGLSAALYMALVTDGQAATCGGHGDRKSLAVQASWLEEHAKDPKVVILAIGQKSEFDQAHIPGSVFLNYMDTHTMPKSQAELSLEMLPMADLAKAFERVGVSNDSHVVLYSLKDGLSPVARVFLTLDAMGLGAQTSILDGGMSAWRAENRPVTAEVRAVTAGKLAPCPQTDVIANVDYVKANLKHAGVAIVDARDPEFYKGEKASMNHTGHIPGAGNITYSTVVDAQGKLKPVAALEEMYRAAGVKAGDRVVSYCHIGQQASVIYFVSRYLGYDARMYDGSWQEWTRSGLPVEGVK